MLYRLEEALMQAMERLLTAAVGLFLGSGACAVRPLLAKNCYSGHTSSKLVLIGGELGRMPTAEIGVRQFLQDGRNRDPYGFSMLLAGGDMDLHATMLPLLGLDHKRLTYHYSGRDCRLTGVEGKVVKDIVA